MASLAAAAAAGTGSALVNGAFSLGNNALSYQNNSKLMAQQFGFRSALSRQEFNQQLQAFQQSNNFLDNRLSSLGIDPAARYLRGGLANYVNATGTTGPTVSQFVLPSAYSRIS